MKIWNVSEIIGHRTLEMVWSNFLARLGSWALWWLSGLFNTRSSRTRLRPLVLCFPMLLSSSTSVFSAAFEYPGQRFNGNKLKLWMPFVYKEVAKRQWSHIILVKSSLGFSIYKCGNNPSSLVRRHWVVKAPEVGNTYSLIWTQILDTGKRAMGWESENLVQALVHILISHMSWFLVVAITN